MQVVEQEFDELFPGQVVAVQPVYDVRELEPLDKEYDKLSRKLWDLVGDYSHKLRDDKKIKKRKQVGLSGVHIAIATGVVSGRSCVEVCLCRPRRRCAPAASHGHGRKVLASARLQVRVLGATMGAWGREKYGLKPVKKDCLEYWPDRLEYLREQILVKTKEAHAKFVPCAFVTFRSGAVALTDCVYLAAGERTGPCTC